MSDSSASGPAPSVTPAVGALLEDLRVTHEARVAAELREVELVRRLCVARGSVDEDAFGEAAEKLTYHGADGTPGVAEFLSLEVAALLGMSPGAGAGFIADVLNCAYRHPALWDAVQAGVVRWYRATEVISYVNAAGLTQDEAAWVDERITPLLATLPRGRAIRRLRGLIAMASPERAREREVAQRAERKVTFWQPGVDAAGCTNVTGRLDAADAAALHATLNRLADALGSQGDESPWDIRRATALGLLAEPERALSLLNQGVDPGTGRAATVVLHITDRALADAALVGRVEGHGPLSRETWIEVLGTSRVTVRPVLDLDGVAPVDSYEIPDRLRTAVINRSPVDLFPYGTTAAARCDLDHTIPYDHSRGRPPGQTRADNLAPLSRRAHRAKTAGHWRVTQDENGWLEWISPAGYRYATGPLGTVPLARAG